VSIAERDGKIVLDATFKGLEPNGSYSLFENHDDKTPITFTTMHGAGKTNSFTAGPDGSAGQPGVSRFVGGLKLKSSRSISIPTAMLPARTATIRRLIFRSA
jgi:hypothetical protein